MNGRTPTKDEERWLAQVEQIPCIVCLLFRETDTPAEIHHIAGQRAQGAHFKTIPLCTRHHRHADTHKPPRWISRHGDGRRAFEREYWSEGKLLDLTKREVKKLEQQAV